MVFLSDKFELSRFKNKQKAAIEQVLFELKEQDRSILLEMANAKKISILGTATTGQSVHDTFLLEGFNSNWEAAKNACVQLYGEISALHLKGLISANS